MSKMNDESIRVEEDRRTRLGINAVSHTAMPLYQCHKKIWAIQIRQLIHTVSCDDGNAEIRSAVIVPVEKGYMPFEVDALFIEEYKPEAGGYYIVGEDGHRSYSPAKDFRHQYYLIGAGHR